LMYSSRKDLHTSDCPGASASSLDTTTCIPGHSRKMYCFQVLALHHQTIRRAP
jgi:hypothetical protein